MTDFSALLAALFSDDTTRYTRASLALFDAGVAAVEPLLTVIKTAHPQHRLRVINLLNELQDRRATPALIDRLRNDTSEENRRAAAAALRDIDDIKAVFALVEALSSDDAKLRFVVVTALDYYGLPHLQAVLHTALQDPVPAVARLAAATLAKNYHDPMGVSVLQQDLEADDPFFEANAQPFVYNALSVLAMLRLPQFADTFRAYLHHNKPGLRIAAVIGLGNLETDEDIPKLVEVYEREQNEDVLVALLVAFAQIGDPHAVAAILRRIHDDFQPSTRFHVARTLGRIGDPIAVETLRQMVESDIDPSVRYQAVLSLADVAHPVAIDLVRAYARSSKPMLREAAIKGLGLLRDAESVELLQQLLATAPRAQAHAAAVSLLRINQTGTNAAYTRLLKDLFHADYEVCWFTLRTLEQFPDERFREPLQAVLEDEDSGTRELAVGVLGEIGDEQAIAELVPLLTDVWSVRRRARQALLKLGYEFK